MFAIRLQRYNKFLIYRVVKTIKLHQGRAGGAGGALIPERGCGLATPKHSAIGRNHRETAREEAGRGRAIDPSRMGVAVVARGDLQAIDK